MGEEGPVEWGISDAADRAGVGVQTLRPYEQRGLVEPRRTTGGTRRYTAGDLDRLTRIGELVAEGINLVGIHRVLELEASIELLHGRLDDAGVARRGGRL